MTDDHIYQQPPFYQFTIARHIILVRKDLSSIANPKAQDKPAFVGKIGTLTGASSRDYKRFDIKIMTVFIMLVRGNIVSIGNIPSLRETPTQSQRL